MIWRFFSYQGKTLGNKSIKDFTSRKKIPKISPPFLQHNHSIYVRIHSIGFKKAFTRFPCKSDEACIWRPDTEVHGAHFVGSVTSSTYWPSGIARKSCKKEELLRGSLPNLNRRKKYTCKHLLKKKLNFVKDQKNVRMNPLPG